MILGSSFGKKGKQHRYGQQLGTFMAVQVAFWTILTCQGLVIFLAAKVDLFPNREALTNTISTLSQIVAGLYGITAAGFTFFLSRIDSLTAANPTLGFVTDSVKKRYQFLMGFITAGMSVILGSTLALLYFPTPETEGFWLFLYRLSCNEFLLFVISTTVLILVYSLMVVDPGCIEKEARKLKQKLSRERGAYGSTAEFLSLYGQMEQMCLARLPQPLLSQLQQGKDLPFDSILEMLEELCPELTRLIPNISYIRHYYECTVNCRPMTVTQEMVLLARETVKKLKQ